MSAALSSAPRIMPGTEWKEGPDQERVKEANVEEMLPL